MISNVRIFGLLLGSLIFLSTSCALFQKAETSDGSDYRDRQFEDFSDKDERTPLQKADLVAKGADVAAWYDTESFNVEEYADPRLDIPAPPPAVDVSDYKPPWYIEREEKQLARFEIVDYSMQFLGLPYVWGGKKPETGFDCSGFTAYVMDRFNVKISPASRLQSKEGEPIKIRQALAGDLIFFGKNGKVSHVAMVTENGEKGLHVIHSTNRGVVVDNIDKSSYWKPRVMFARRVLE